jgi:hypothetical protein
MTQNMLRSVTSIIAMVLLLTAIIGVPSKRANALTFVIDFDPVAQFAFNTTAMSAFDVTPYGFTAGQRNTVISSVMTELRNDFYNIVSPSIPSGQQLAIDFVLGTVGYGGVTANGDIDYYYIAVGNANNASEPLGEAFLNGAFGTAGNTIGAVYTDEIFSGVFNALGTPGDLFQTTHVLEGTLAHEIGHTLGLEHCDFVGVVTPNGLDPLMASGATGLPNASRLTDREFSTSCTISGGTQTSIDQLITNVGLEDAPVVPEPATILILGIGLAGIRFMRR